MQLLDLLTLLNTEIDRYNADLAEAVEAGEVDADTAAVLKVQAGSATVAMVIAEDRPEAFMRAVEACVSEERPQEIMRLAKSCHEPTATTKAIHRGCGNAKGMYPVLVRTIDLAHLMARAG